MPVAGVGKPYLNGRRFWGNFCSYADEGRARAPRTVWRKEGHHGLQSALRLFVARVDALDALRTAQPRGRSAAAVDASVTLRAFAERFLAELGEEWDTNGIATHAAHHLGRRSHGIMTCLDLPSLRGVLLADVTPELCEQVLRELRAHQGTRGPLKPSTQRSYVMELSAVFTFAVEKRLLVFNPIHNQHLIPKIAAVSALDPTKVLSMDEARRLLDALRATIQSPYAAEILYVLLYNGVPHVGATTLH